MDVFGLFLKSISGEAAGLNSPWRLGPTDLMIGLGIGKSRLRMGMTLVEIMITVSIIGLLAVCLVPAVNHSMKQRENLNAATHLRAALSAFELYASEQGGYPADRTPSVVPPEMAGYYFPYYKIDWWTDETPLGGNWDWDNGFNYAYSVSIHAPNRSENQLEMLDAMIDDGDLTTGLFRRQGSHYHYIIREVE